MIIDDGAGLASSVDDKFTNITTALHAAVRSAILIASEEADHRADQSFLCEVKDPRTQEAQQATVRLTVEFSNAGRTGEKSVSERIDVLISEDVQASLIAVSHPQDGGSRSYAGSNHRRWTPVEDALLREQWAVGSHMAKIAAIFGRSQRSVNGRLAMLGLRREDGEEAAAGTDLDLAGK